MLRLNLGAGRDIREDWINVDGSWNPHADVTWNFDSEVQPAHLFARGVDPDNYLFSRALCAELDIDYSGPDALAIVGPNSVDEAEASHVIEHVRHVLPFMQALHSLMKPDGVLVVRAPYGSSDDADTDPTHVRRLFKESWAYFGQPNYWRADYGYRGDWRVEEIELTIHPRIPRNTPPAALDVLLLRDRNVVVEQVVLLRAVKPIREPLKELADKPILTAKWTT